jgi:hypothetical protein
MVHVRAALAWSQMPSVWWLALWIPLLGLSGSEMFTTETPRLYSNLLLLAVLFGYIAITIVILIWQLVLFFKCVGEAHQFSAWKAVGASLIAAALLLAVIVIPLAIIIGLSVAAGG